MTTVCRPSFWALVALLVSPALAQKAAPWDMALSPQPAQHNTFMADPLGGFCGVPVELGDYDGDGFVDFAIAPILADGGPTGNRTDSGVIHVMKGTGTIGGVIDLATPPMGSVLATVWGGAMDDYLGTEMYSADLNDDGLPDLILGASGYDSGTANTVGAVYVLWGGPNFQGTIDLATPPSWVTVIRGIDAADRLGFWVEAGDINGDGIDDLLMSADDGNGQNNANVDRGEAYVIYGGQTFPPLIDLGAPPPGLSMVTVFGEDNGDQLGSSMHSVDLDQDGFEELIVSAGLNRAIGVQTGAGSAGGDGPGNSRNNCGDTYIVWGAANLPSTINLNSDRAAMLAAGSLTIIHGANNNDFLGEELASGNIDGDAYPDLVLGAITADGLNNALPNAGDCVVLWGGPQLRGQVIDMATTPAGTATLYGEAIGDIGADTLSLGDVNGDGFDDLFFAEPNGDPQRPGGNTNNAGELVIIFGGPRRFPTEVEVSALSASLAWPTRRIWGADPEDLMGYSMEGGDVDQDGFADIFPNSMRGDGFGNAYNDAGEIGIVSGQVFSRGIVTLTTPPAIGTTVNFHLVGLPNQLFIAAFALAPTPAQNIPGFGTVFLAPDFIFQMSVMQTAPLFTNLQGMTSADGRATFTLPLPNDPAGVGITGYTSFVTLDPTTFAAGTIGHTTEFTITN